MAGEMCMTGGVRGRGHVWQGGACVVRILLECILVDHESTAIFGFAFGFSKIIKASSKKCKGKEWVLHPFFALIC